MKFAVITGGSRGIGAALVSLYKKNGWKVLSLDISEPTYKVPGVIYEKADIKDANRLKDIAEQCGRIDLLINNAAIQHIKLLKDYSDKEIKDMIDTNILGTINVTRAFLSRLNNGLIINIGSVHSSVPRTHKIPYDISKAALVMFTKEIALELEEQNTRALCVEFGAVKTPMNDDFQDESQKKTALEKQVIDHLMTSEECAEVVYELSSDKFQYMNGEVIKYDCGRSLK